MYDLSTILFVVFLAVIFTAFLGLRGKNLARKHAVYRSEVFSLRQAALYQWQRDNCGIDTIDTMTGEEFESRLANLFARLGWDVTKTKASGDFGADLVCHNLEATMVVQAKRSASPIGVRAVQEVVAAKTYYNAQHAVVVTNNSFTLAAKQLATSNNVTLYDRQGLIELLLATQSQPPVVPTPLPEPTLPPPNTWKRLITYVSIGWNTGKGLLPEDPNFTFLDWLRLSNSSPNTHPRIRSLLDIALGLRRCEYCGRSLPRNRRRWCSDRCGQQGRQQYK
jgi:restriction system protein